MDGQITSNNGLQELVKFARTNKIEVVVVWGARTEEAVKYTTVSADSIFKHLEEVLHNPPAKHVYADASKMSDFGYADPIQLGEGVKSVMVFWYVDDTDTGSPNIWQGSLLQGGSAARWRRPQITTNNNGHLFEQSGSEVTVSAGSWHTIVDLSNPRSVVSGWVNGPTSSALRVTFGDDTTMTIGGTSGTEWAGYDSGESDEQPDNPCD